MAHKPSRRVPEELAATREEIEQAIETLADADSLRLRHYAQWRIRGLGRARLGRESEDLLGEAVTSTLVAAEGGERGRRWNKNVDFVKHLTEAMRSISDHWRQQFDENEAQIESELTTITQGGEERSPFADLRSEQPDAERTLSAKERVALIFKEFDNDDEAILVLEGLTEGMTGPEIMGLGLTKQQYEAAVKRIRYVVRKKKI